MEGNIQLVFTEQVLRTPSSCVQGLLCAPWRFGVWIQSNLSVVYKCLLADQVIVFFHSWTWLCPVNFIHRHLVCVYLLKGKNNALILSIFAFFRACVLKSMNSECNSVMSSHIRLVWVGNAKFTYWSQSQERWNCVSNGEWLWMSFLLYAVLLSTAKLCRFQLLAKGW